MKLVKKIMECGVKELDNPSDKRTTILSNYLSLILFIAIIVLVILRYFLFSKPIDFNVSFAALLFLSPIFINFLGFTQISKIYLCWLPTFVIGTIYYLSFKSSVNIQSSTYDSLRIYLLGVSCIPFLLLSTLKKKEFFFGIIIPFLSIVFCDQILNYLKVGYGIKGISGDDYLMNNMRTIVAYIIIGGSCFSLKRLLEKSNEQNEELLNVISEQNKLDQLNARQLLDEATTRLTLATQSAGIGIWEWDLNTDKLIWDNEMYNIFGFDYLKNKNKNVIWKNYVYFEDYDDLMVLIEEAINTKDELNCEFRIQKGTGEISFVHTFGKVYLEDGKAFKMIGVCWDISIRKISETQLQQSEANFYAVINNTTYFIWSVNQNFEIVNVNRPFKEYLKTEYDLERIEGLFINDPLFLKAGIKELSDTWLTKYKRALTGESFEIEEAQNNKFFKYALNPIIENAMVTGVSVFVEDITDFKKKEIQLKEANNKIGELKLMALRAAMNPHFIFNSLNSIQYFIMENDPKNATKYLSTFSKLIRGILNNSIENKIKLSVELEQIIYYVKLEQLRFTDKFDFIMNVDESIETEDIEIPSMLIQPYIENAILHGLYNKGGRGTLKLSVKEIDQRLIFEIDDDGIGREESRRLQTLNLPLHKSRGTLITEERLKLINNQDDVSFEILDKVENGKSAGTKVKIFLN